MQPNKELLASSAFDTDRNYSAAQILARDATAFIYNNTLYAVVPQLRRDWQNVVFEFGRSGKRWKCFGIGRYDRSNVETLRPQGTLLQKAVRRTYKWQSLDELTDGDTLPILEKLRQNDKEAASRLLDALCLQIKDLKHFEAFMLALQLTERARSQP